jgi:hypothetical protein
VDCPGNAIGWSTRCLRSDPGADQRAALKRTAQLSQELSHNPRPRRDSNGHLGNENPHDGVVSLPHVVVWLAFKSLVSTEFHHSEQRLDGGCTPPNYQCKVCKQLCNFRCRKGANLWIEIRTLGV